METKTATHRREKILIIIDVLDALRVDSLKLTHLIYQSNLSHPRLKVYLDEFIRKGFVVEEDKDGGKLYSLTGEGQRFHDECIRVHEQIRLAGLMTA